MAVPVEERYWAIPEINGTPPKENMSFTNFVLIFAVGIPKINHFFFFATARVKKMWEFTNFLHIFHF